MQKLNVLAAFPYLTDKMVSVLNERAPNIRFLCDSGAFTAFKQGKPIALDDYCRFLERLPFEPWRYFTLDVIGDGHATRANYAEMMRRGFKPVPVFTRGEDPAALDDYFATSDVVGLGGLAGTSQPPGPYLKWLWPQLAGRHVHVLGFSTMMWLKVLRPYSCDSSNWLYGTRYANVGVYVGKGNVRWINNAKFKQRPPDDVMTAIARLGFDPYLLQRQTSWNGGNSLVHWISAASWVALQLDVAKNVGTQFFLACAAADTIPIITSCFAKQTTGEWSVRPPTV